MAVKHVPPAAIDESMVTSNVAETVSAWSSVTTYGAAALSRRALDGIQHVFESVAGSNLNHDPALDVDGTYWTDLGATNKFAMFDGGIQTQTENADEIAVDVAFGDGVVFDHGYFDNLAGTELNVVVTDGDAVERFNETFSLISTSGIVDFWPWCFTPIRRIKAVVIEDLPPYPGATLSVSVTEPGATVKCGAVVVGFGQDLGNLQWGAQVGIVDYSIKGADDFGNFRPVERPYSKRANLTLNTPADFTDVLLEYLADYRAVPSLYIGDINRTSTAVWGYFREVAEEIAYDTHSVTSLEVEGLS